MPRKENKQGAPAGGPAAQGDLAVSADLHFLTPLPEAADGDDPGIKYQQGSEASWPVRWALPPPCPSGSPPGRRRALLSRAEQALGQESHVPSGREGGLCPCGN